MVHRLQPKWILFDKEFEIGTIQTFLKGYISGRKQHNRFDSRLGTELFGG
jgi:hypothetical protein